MLKILFLFLMSGGIPVAIAMAGSALLYLLLVPSSPPFVVIHRMVSGIDSFPLLAVPFFILAGNLMNHFDMTKRIFEFLEALVGMLLVLRRHRVDSGVDFPSAVASVHDSDSDRYL